MESAAAPLSPEFSVLFLTLAPTPENFSADAFKQGDP